MEARISVNLEKMSYGANYSLYAFVVGFFFLGYYISFYFHFLTVAFFLITIINLYFLYVQKEHALLSNFGYIAQIRYLVESVGPEFRQYLFMSDTEEKPFNRIERSEVYQKAKGTDSSSAFGSLCNYDHSEIKLRHSMFPINKKSLKPFNLIFGEERGIKNTLKLSKPVMISAMSFGALSTKAVRSLARGAKLAGIPMNTGEGGFPKYHLMEGCDLIFQMGTAKFGVRNGDGSLNEKKLEQMAQLDQVKMIEIKLSQGAKPGKGGLLPKEKITEEIAELRGVLVGKDVISPAYHLECRSPQETVNFIARVQEVSGLPVGIKLCLGKNSDFESLIREMKNQNTFCDYLALDGAEGGTGAAPKSFLDDVGVPIYKALKEVQSILIELEVRDRFKLIASGKMINAGDQLMGMSLGADAIYTARGFMLAIGCIQALQCNKNSCPVGITTHQPNLLKGLDIEEKSLRVRNYVNSLWSDHKEVLAALGKYNHKELNEDNLYIPKYY